MFKVNRLAMARCVDDVLWCGDVILSKHALNTMAIKRTTHSTHVGAGITPR